MMDRPAEFKRMVLSLPHSSTDYAAVAFTAELAALLGVDLVGIFTADESLLSLAALPCVRELRHSGGWHPVDSGEMEECCSRAAAEARRLFGEAVKVLRPGAHFDVAKGTVAETIDSQSTADDIVAVIEPRNPAERVTHQFRQLLTAAFASPSATLLIPSRVVRRRGPVVAIATSEHDTSIRTALRVAELTQERLLLFVSPRADEVSLARLAATATVPIKQRRLQESKIRTSDLNALLPLTGERLLVLSRGADASMMAPLAFERAVPLLVTEPARETTSSALGSDQSR
jgi:hypothetical protein